MDQPSRVIVMKVGVHLSEPWEAIVERSSQRSGQRASSIGCGPVTRYRASVAPASGPMSPSGRRVRENALYLVWKIVERLARRWRALNGGATVMTLVLAGARFEDGILGHQPPREEVQAA